VDNATYLVDDKVHVTRRDHLPVKQVPLVAHAADRSAGGLDGHHLLHHLFFVCVKEARELGGVERGIQLEEAAQRGNGCLSAHVSEEERKVALGGLRRWVLRISRQLFLVLVRRRVGGNELRARIEEELFESRKTLIAVDKCRSLLYASQTIDG